MDNRKVISGNITRRIWNSKERDVIHCTSVNEAHKIVTRGNELGCKMSQRGCNVLVVVAIDKTKYLWLSGDPVQDNRKPSLKGVE